MAVKRCNKSSHSDRKAGSNGERSAAMVATIEAMSPITRTVDSSTPKERVETWPLPEKKAGAIARIAASVPVTSPQQTRKAFSVTTINVKCFEL